MADGFVISISSEVWQKRVIEYVAATGKNVVQALDEEWPLLIRKVIEFTPPFKTRAAVTSTGASFSASDYSVGRSAVASDIYKTMRPFDPGTVKTKGMERIIRMKDIAAFNIVAERSNKSPLMAGSQAIEFSPQVHLGQRNSRGRVTGRDRPKVVIGTDAVLLKRYVKSVQAHVGWARSGWAAAYNLVRAPDGYSLPNWVTRQGEGGGGVIDERGDENYPSITARNWTSWAVRKDEGERIKADAYASRITAIKAKIITYMRLSRKQAGFEGTEAAA